MAGLLQLWNKWNIHILVLISFALQVLLLFFARMRRRSISHALRVLLWFMYLVADSTAIYTLGHLSISCNPGAQQQLVAFCAPFLLVHLGGQDTITAYAMEDNQLWLRHLFTLFVQALGVGYVLYKNFSYRGPLFTPAVLMFLVGILKNGERVWALSFSRLEIIRKFLDGIPIKQKGGPYSACTHLDGDTRLDAESVLQGAHDLLYICMDQFVDDKIWPTEFQSDAIKLFYNKGKTFELIEMQLSLMYDILYTKAAVIHTRYGCCIRAISLLGTVMAFFLFEFSIGQYGFNGVDAAVTYILIIGALILEISSVLRAMGSTWTCTMLKESRRWHWLHCLHVSLRRCVRIAQTRRWSGSIGQLNLLDSSIAGTRSLGSKTTSFLTNDSNMVSPDTKKLVLEEILRMAKACKGKEDVMRSYRGQCSLKRPDLFLEGLTWSMDKEFDQSILAWHLATDKLLRCPESINPGPPLVEATKAISNYMMFLLVERPYMLPPPIRSTLHLKARQALLVEYEWFMDKNNEKNKPEDPVLIDGANLAVELLSTEIKLLCNDNEMELLQVVFGVWVEMLCYAAHHCSRDSHARQLNSGGEFITVVWLLTNVELDRVYYNEGDFKERKHGSFWNFINFINFTDFKNFILWQCYSLGRKIKETSYLVVWKIVEFIFRPIFFLVSLCMYCCCRDQFEQQCRRLIEALSAYIENFWVLIKMIIKFSVHERSPPRHSEAPREEGPIWIHAPQAIVRPGNRPGPRRSIGSKAPREDGPVWIDASEAALGLGNDPAPRRSKSSTCVSGAEQASPATDGAEQASPVTETKGPEVRRHFRASSF